MMETGCDSGMRSRVRDPTLLRLSAVAVVLALVTHVLHQPKLSFT